MGTCGRRHRAAVQVADHCRWHSTDQHGGHARSRDAAGMRRGVSKAGGDRHRGPQLMLTVDPLSVRDPVALMEIVGASISILEVESLTLLDPSVISTPLDEIVILVFWTPSLISLGDASSIPELVSATE